MTLKNIFAFLDKIGSEDNIKEVVNKPDSLFLRYTISCYLNIKMVKKIRDYIVFPTEEINLIIQNNFINNDNGLDNILENFIGEDNIECKFTIKYKPDCESFHFYTKTGYLDFLKHFIKLPVSYLAKKEKRITIHIHKNYNFVYNSTIFNFTNEKIDIDSSTLKSIKILNKKDLPLGIIPGCLDSDTLMSLPKAQTHFFKSLLSSISNDNSDKKYYFKGQYNKTLILDNEANKNLEKHLQDLFSLYEYIYYHDISADQKKTFARKSICNNLKYDMESNISELSSSYFEDIKNETEYLYTTFEDGEISIFLKEKKEIIKEYSDLSKGILQNINQIKASLNNNLRTIITIIIINFGLKIVSNNAVWINKLVLTMAILFLILNITILTINDYGTYKNMKDKQKVFEKQFAFLSNKILDFKTELNTIVTKEFSNYESSLAITGFTYIITLLILILLCIFF